MGKLNWGLILKLLENLKLSSFNFLQCSYWLIYFYIILFNLWSGSWDKAIGGVRFRDYSNNVSWDTFVGEKSRFWSCMFLNFLLVKCIYEYYIYGLIICNKVSLLFSLKIDWLNKLIGYMWPYLDKVKSSSS